MTSSVGGNSPPTFPLNVSVQVSVWHTLPYCIAVTGYYIAFQLEAWQVGSLTGRETERPKQLLICLLSNLEIILLTRLASGAWTIRERATHSAGDAVKDASWRYCHESTRCCYRWCAINLLWQRQNRIAAAASFHSHCPTSSSVHIIDLPLPRPTSSSNRPLRILIVLRSMLAISFGAWRNFTCHCHGHKKRSKEAALNALIDHWNCTSAFRGVTGTEGRLEGMWDRCTWRMSNVCDMPANERIDSRYTGKGWQLIRAGS